MSRLAALLGTLALLAAGCGGGSSKNESASPPTTTTQTQTTGGETNEHGTKTVSEETEVELDDDYFDPTVLKGAPGAKVKLELKNEGTNEHNFTLTAQGIDQDVESGEDAKVTVTIPQSGRVAFFCKYHKSVGMVGALEASG
jgi:plastocyanin